MFSNLASKLSPPTPADLRSSALNVFGLKVSAMPFVAASVGTTAEPDVFAPVLKNSPVPCPPPPAPRTIV